MVAIQGVFCFEQHARENEQHITLAKYKSELIENQVGNGQGYLTDHGDYKHGWNKQLGVYFDLYCIGALIENLVDLRRIENYHYAKQTLIYDDLNTEIIQLSLERSLPARSKQILNLIDSIKFGDDIPEELYRLLGSWYRVNSRMNATKLYKVSSRDRNDYMSDSSGPEDVSSRSKRRRRPTRFEIFQQLHQESDSN